MSILTKTTTTVERRSSDDTVSRRTKLLSIVLGIVAALSVSAAVAPAASAGETGGIVAVHDGSWGYREVVFGKAWTRRLADGPDLGILSVGVGYLGPAAAPAAVYAYLVQWRAQDALRNGQCFAMVRPTWARAWFPAKEYWGCR